MSKPNKFSAVMIVHRNGTTEMPARGRLSASSGVRDAVGTKGVRNRGEAKRLLENDSGYVSVIVASSETSGQAVFAGAEPTEAQLDAVTLEYLTRNDASLAAEVARLGDDNFDPSTVPAQTEGSAMALVRMGQGRFRKELEKEGGRCWITGASIYIASHIRPWKSSGNADRLDPANGLLLSPNYDALFDEHRISFDPTGKIVIGSLTPSDRAALAVDPHAKLTCSLTTRRKEFLVEHHRQLR